MDNAHSLAHATTRSSVPAVPASRSTAPARSSIQRLAQKSTRAAYVLQAFAAQVAGRADLPAIHCGEDTLSYAELDRRSNQLAHALLASGVKREELIGVHLDRCLELPVALLAVLKAGCAFLPLDPGLPAGRLAQLVEEAQPALVLTTTTHAETLQACGVSLLSLDAVSTFLWQRSQAAPEVAVTEHQLAYVIFTSGSTGRPKGVEVCHDNLENYLRSMAIEPGLKAGDRSLALATIAFDMSIFDFWLPLVVGSEIVLGEADLGRDVKRLHARLDCGDITLLHATPTTLRMLIEAGWQGDERLSVLSGGEAMTRELADAVLKRCGALFNGYGPTETTVCATLERVATSGPISIGRAIHNATTYVLDTNLRPVAAGETGELWIGGRGVARGYLRRPDLTAERFRTDPFSTLAGARMYRTGDAVRLGEDGRLFFIGRLDDQVKIRGHRIELGEVEAVLAAAPGVSGAVVKVHSGRGGDALAGYYTGSDAPGAAQLRAYLKHKLPAYMVPATLDWMAELPRSASGKVDRKALPAPQNASATSANGAAPEVENAGAKMANHLEQAVAGAFASVLGLSAVQPEDDFFDLGGSSLLAVRVQRRLEAELEREIPLKVFFENGTVRALATALALDAGTTEPEVVAIQPHGQGRPVFCLFGVRHYWPLANELRDLDRPFYGLHLEREEAAFYAEGQSAAGRAQQLLAMAEQYAARVKALQPEGPYTLVGHSTGGIVAFETARLLRERGAVVDNLILLDTVLPQGVARSASQAVRHRVRLSRRALQRVTTQVAMRLGQQTVLSSLRAAFERKLEDYEAERNRLNHLRAYEVAEAYWQEHVARPYDGPAIFVHALGRQEPCGDVDDHGGWRSLVLGVFDVVSVASGHREMMRTPGVAELGASLRPFLKPAAAVKPGSMPRLFERPSSAAQAR